ncbi:MAG: carboxypeptidase-like regulatory domain-containing protein, partial [Planctomycetes bacterium]|nr:carboxypeptidase-like regulatory domain-containing protein [Planctomycetota bacterium]
MRSPLPQSHRERRAVSDPRLRIPDFVQSTFRSLRSAICREYGREDYATPRPSSVNFAVLCVSVPLWLTLCSLALAQPAPERYTVSGRVTDKKTQKPLAGAVVMLRIPDEKGNWTRIHPIPGINGMPTNPDGTFTFDGVPEGDYQFMVQVSYYHPFSQPLSLWGGPAPTLNAEIMPYNVIACRLLKPDGSPAANAPAALAFRTPKTQNRL